MRTECFSLAPNLVRLCLLSNKLTWSREDLIDPDEMKR